MIRIKLIVFVFSLLSICTSSNSQILNKEVLSTYSPGVITKLYDIVKLSPLSDEQQIQIATQLDQTDKLIAESIKQGKSIDEIDKLQQIQNFKILSILGKDVMNYTSKKGESFAKAASYGEANFIQENYKIDSFLANKLRAVQYNKYKNFYQQFLLYGFTESKSIEQIAKVSKRYDSLLFTIYTTLFTSRYLNNYLKEAKQVKPAIADSTIKKIEIAFNEFSGKNIFIDMGQTMLEIMQHIYPDTALTAHFYKPVLDRQSSYLSSVERQNLFNVYHISPFAYDSINKIIKQKNYQQVLIEITYGGNSKYRDSILKKVTLYYDSLIYISLLRNGSLLSSNQFAIALKFKKELQLRPSLIDTLLFHAMYLHNKQDSALAKDPFAKTDYKAYEAMQLNNLLSEEQYTRLLSIKNTSQAKLDTDDDWDDIKKWGIAKNLDEETVKKELYKYYMAKWNAFTEWQMIN